MQRTTPPTVPFEVRINMGPYELINYPPSDPTQSSTAIKCCEYSASCFCSIVTCCFPCLKWLSGRISYNYTPPQPTPPAVTFSSTPPPHERQLTRSDSFGSRGSDDEGGGGAAAASQFWVTYGKSPQKGGDKEKLF